MTVSPQWHKHWVNYKSFAGAPLSRAAAFLLCCTDFLQTQVHVVDIFEQQGVKKSKAPLFLTGGSNDTNFLQKRKSETESNFYIFHFILFDALMSGACTSSELLHSVLSIVWFMSFTTIFIYFWMSYSCSCTAWMTAPSQRQKNIKWMCQRYMLIAAASLLGALHKICDRPGAFRWKSNQSCRRSVNVGRNRITPRQHSAGPAATNIWPGFKMHLVCKYAPEGGLPPGEWPAISQTHRDKTSGHLQLTITDPKASQSVI